MSEQLDECAVCKEPIERGGLKALGKNWHKEHFQCGHCHKELGNQKFIQRNGVPYCKADYENLFSRTSSQLNVTMARSMTAIGMNFRTERFTCGSCNQDLSNQKFFQRGGIRYCKTDYDNLFSPKCASCNATVTGGLKALGKHWHEDHFQCGHCQEQLSVDSYFQRDGVPYCSKDYHNLFSPKCAHCQTAITGDLCNALGKKWHPEHFFCAKCKKPFGKERFTENDGKPYCQEDYLILFVQKCPGCNIPIAEEYILDGSIRWHSNCFAIKDLKPSTH